jgi:hypothetical protein
MQGDPGFPDLVLARRGRVIFAELKSEKGHLTKEQASWLGHLSSVRGTIAPEVYEWRPSDLPEIQSVLSAGRGHA